MFVLHHVVHHPPPHAHVLIHHVMALLHLLRHELGIVTAHVASPHHMSTLIRSVPDAEQSHARILAASARAWKTKLALMVTCIGAKYGAMQA